MALRPLFRCTVYYRATHLNEWMLMVNWHCEHMWGMSGGQRNYAAKNYRNAAQNTGEKCFQMSEKAAGRTDMAGEKK